MTLGAKKNQVDTDYLLNCIVHCSLLLNGEHRTVVYDNVHCNVQCPNEILQMVEMSCSQSVLVRIVNPPDQWWCPDWVLACHLPCKFRTCILKLSHQGDWKRRLWKMEPNDQSKSLSFKDLSLSWKNLHCTQWPMVGIVNPPMNGPLWRCLL